MKRSGPIRRKTPLQPGGPLKRKTRIRRMAKDTAKEKRANDQMSAAFLRYNKVCACGCGAPSETWHHIAAGAGKEPTRFDTDLALPAAPFCNSSDVFHDNAVWPRARQLARKVQMIHEKYNRAAVRQVKLEQVVAWLDLDWDYLAELLQQRNGG